MRPDRYAYKEWINDTMLMLARYDGCITLDGIPYRVNRDRELVRGDIYELEERIYQSLHKVEEEPAKIIATKSNAPAFIGIDWGAFGRGEIDINGVSIDQYAEMYIGGDEVANIARILGLTSKRLYNFNLKNFDHEDLITRNINRIKRGRPVIGSSVSIESKERFAKLWKAGGATIKGITFEDFREAYLNGLSFFLLGKMIYNTTGVNAKFYAKVLFSSEETKERERNIQKEKNTRR